MTHPNYGYSKEEIARMRNAGRTHRFNTSIGRHSANEPKNVYRSETPLGQRDKR